MTLRSGLLALLLLVGGCLGNDAGALGHRPIADSIPEPDPAQIIEVVDGDSLVMSVSGDRTDVRLVGINAPERDECLGIESGDNLARLVAGRLIGIVTSGTDQYGRTLAIVTADGEPVNLLQVADGLAIPLAADTPLEGSILSAEAEARAGGIGLWSPESCGTGPLADVALVDIEPNPPGNDEEKLDEERVTIRNNGPTRVDLAGWVLRDESTANRFRFGDGVALDPGSSLQVVTGCSSGPGVVAWCSDTPVWNNGGDTAFLIDRDGRIVDLLRYRVDR